MFTTVYNWLIKGYGTMAQLAALRNEKARLFVEGRRNGWEPIVQLVQSAGDHPILWFHCASLGEFEQARPVIEAIRLMEPDTRILLTFFSPSGYEVRKNYPHADCVAYLPLDTTENARRLVGLVKPRAAFFVKYEFWHNYLKALSLHRIPVISFSAIFRPSQPFFKPWGGFFRKSLARFAHIFVQDEASAQLLRSIGLTAVTVAGDSRFDRVKQIVDARKPIPVAEAFKNGQLMLVAGSTWPKDVEVLAAAAAQLRRPIKLMIAPHQISEPNIAQSISLFADRTCIRFSEAAGKDLANADVLIIDNIGMLSSLYAYGEMAYVGGAFQNTLHNTVEPAVYGIPVMFGEHYDKFREARELIRVGGGHSVKKPSELANLLNRYLEEATQREKAGKAAGEYVAENLGATEKVVQFYRQLFRQT